MNYKQFTAIIFSISLFLFAFILCAEAAPIVGGSCSYDEFGGQCKIVSISNSKFASGEAVPGKDVNFKFTPDKPIDLKNVGWVKDAKEFTDREQSESLDYLASNWNDLDKNNLKENDIVSCKLGLITGGTCTPAVFTFISKTNNNYKQAIITAIIVLVALIVIFLAWFLTRRNRINKKVNIGA